MLRRTVAFVVILVFAHGLPGQGVSPSSLDGNPKTPLRDPHTPGFVAAVDLKDGQLPLADEDGNFVLGPTHRPALETQVNGSVPHGTE